MPAINETLYRRQLMYKNSGVLSGEFEKEVEIGDDWLPWETPIIAAFLADDEIQHITIVSTNIGFVKTLSKQFAK